MNTLYKRIVSLAVLIVFAWLSARFFQADHVWQGVKMLAWHPVWLTSMLLVYLLSFCLKAAAWKLYMPEHVCFRTALYGILYSLLINHLLPVKAGDIVRAKVMSVRESHISDEQSFHSVVVLRLLDMAVLLTIAVSGLFFLDWPFSVSKAVLVGISAATAAAVLLMLLRPAFVRRHLCLFRSAMAGKNGMAILGLTAVSWLLEASVVYGTAVLLYGGLSIMQAVFVNSLTVAGQVFQVTPGGIGNYESFFVFGLRLFDFPLQEAYTAALLTHGLKFVFSYTAGFVVWQASPLSIRDMKKWISIKGVGKK